MLGLDQATCLIWRNGARYATASWTGNLKAFLRAFRLFAQSAAGGLARFIREPQISFGISTSRTGYLNMNTTPQELTLNRTTYTDKSTIGELWIDGNLFCYTLEPCARSGPKVPALTAIPAKRYLVNIQYSNKLGKKMPFLVDVPDFEGIMIHIGNFPSDTKGCILVGLSKGIDYIGESKAAFDKLLPIIHERTDNMMLFLTVLGGRVG